MTIKIKLSNELVTEINNGHLKTVNAIKHILASGNSIKTDIQDVTKTALKDLYIIDNINNTEKYHCYFGQIDNVNNTINLSF